MEIHPRDKKIKNNVDVTQLRMSFDELLADSDEEGDKALENNENPIPYDKTKHSALNKLLNDEASGSNSMNISNYLDVTNFSRMSFESLLGISSEEEEWETTTETSVKKTTTSEDNNPESIADCAVINKLPSPPVSKKSKDEIIKPQVSQHQTTNNNYKNNNNEYIQSQRVSNGHSDISTQKRPQFKSQFSDEAADENILALSLGKGQLGAAYYNLNTSELFVMDDVIEDDFKYNITKALYKQCQPQNILLTSGTHVSFVNVITKLIMKDTLDEKNQSSSSSSCSTDASSMDKIVRSSLQFLPKKENNYENCFYRVNCLKLLCEPDKATNAERITFLNSLLNFKSRMMIHALGLLVRYLDVNWNRLSLNPSGQAQYTRINYIMLKDLVMIEEDSYKALNIMQSRFHPGLFKFGGISSFKGSCLFTFLNRCQSRPGMQRLWKLMRHPTRNIDTLKERFRAIEFFLCPNNQNIVETLKVHLKHVSQLTQSIINKYSTTQTKATDWNKFNTTISNIINIGEICGQYRDSADIFAKITDSITDEMHYIRYFIDHIVDLEMSKKHRKFIVKAGVDLELDELNHTRHLLPQLLTEMATRELENLPPNVETCRMIYVPDIQHCLAITSWNGSPPSDDEEIPGLEFKFMIDGLRYYKSDGARELDENYGDILLKITRRQSQIMLRLIQYVSKNIGPILTSIEYSAELDVLLSFAMVARDHNYVKPEIIKSHIINIKNGRHPLKELSGNFVANDTLSSDDTSLVKIFTGPNSCGKTIYLKQIALIVFMAHIGCYVPADSATIGIVTHILTQIPSMESISQSASSFLIDLRQVNNILYSSTPNCLIIMDEFGKGTTQVDALSLLTSTLISFIDRGKYCPHIFVATHLHRSINLIPEISIFEAQTFEFLINEDKSIVFLYRLLSGNIDCSYAHAAAKSAGLSDVDVTRSIEVFEYMKKGKLPPITPKKDRTKILRHMAELISEKNDEDINLNILKQWVKQAL